MLCFLAAHLLWLKLWTYPAVRFTPILPPITLHKERPLWHLFPRGVFAHYYHLEAILTAP